MPKKAKKQTGKGVKEILSAINGVVKDNKLISRGLSSVSPALGALASLTGYGRKRRAPRKAAAPKLRMVGRGQVGSGIFSDIGGGIGSIAHGFFGGGRSHAASAAPYRNAISM